MTILTRSFTSALAVRDDGDGRTLHGPLLPYRVEARVLDRGRLVVETFARVDRAKVVTKSRLRNRVGP